MKEFSLEEYLRNPQKKLLHAMAEVLGLFLPIEKVKIAQL